MQEFKEMKAVKATVAAYSLGEWLRLVSPMAHPDLRSDVRRLCRSLREWLGWDA